MRRWRARRARCSAAEPRSGSTTGARRRIGKLGRHGRLGHGLRTRDGRWHLVLAVATFSSVRSANRAARAAERSLLAGLRPVLMPSRLQDPPQKVSFFDQHWVTIEGGHAAFEVTRRRSTWSSACATPEPASPSSTGGTSIRSGSPAARTPRPKTFGVSPVISTFPPEISASGRVHFATRTSRSSRCARDAAARATAVTIDLLYGDHEGGQRMISRFALHRCRTARGWPSSARHWNLDRPNPR